MPQTSITTVHAGPAWVLIGDPTTGVGAGMVEIGLVPSVEVKLEIMRQVARNELNQALKDGVFGAVIGASVSMTVQGISAAILAAVLEEMADGTTSISAETALANFVLGTMCIVPDDVKGDTAHSNLKTQWLPSVYTTDIGAFIHRLISGGGDDANPYTVQFAAALAATDQGGQAMNTEYGIWFRGDPEDGINETTPTVWSLPTSYE